MGSAIVSVDLNPNVLPLQAIIDFSVRDNNLTRDVALPTVLLPQHESTGKAVEGLDGLIPVHNHVAELSALEISVVISEEIKFQAREVSRNDGGGANSLVGYFDMLGRLNRT
jgi:hypothetical protein